MQLAHESLKGLDRDRVISVVEPILRAHGVDAVELIWRSDSQGWVLYLTVERPGSADPAAGVTLDLCAEISRDLSAALDVADCIPGARYRLEVGSPGIDRALYGVRDYARFAGKTAKFKLREPVDGQRVLRGALHGMSEDGFVLLTADGKEHRLAPAIIESGKLTLDFDLAKGRPDHGRSSQKRAGRSAPRDR
ncbi:MAG TPA: ribosome maturation factor RimP [Polyangiaceae bacterium]|nr:ribosome maturation factor RimP [Polyangiaceae bacterium]